MSGILVKRYILDYNELQKILDDKLYSKKLVLSDFDNNFMFEIEYDNLTELYTLNTDKTTFIFKSLKTLINFLKNNNFMIHFLYAKIYYICDFDCNDDDIQKLYDHLIKDKDNLYIKKFDPNFDYEYANYTFV